MNSLAPHPHHLPLFAASGLDNDAKLFRPCDSVVCAAQLRPLVSVVTVLSADFQAPFARSVCACACVSVRPPLCPGLQTYDAEKAATVSANNTRAREREETSMPLFMRRMLQQAAEEMGSDNDEDDEDGEDGGSRTRRVPCNMM